MSGRFRLILLLFISLVFLLQPVMGECATNVDRFGKTPLHVAARNGDAEIVNLLLQDGALVNARNRFNRTPLQMAVFGGHRQVAQTLLDNGARRDLRNVFGRSALDYAVRNRDTEMVRLLIRY